MHWCHSLKHEGGTWESVTVHEIQSSGIFQKHIEPKFLFVLFSPVISWVILPDAQCQTFQHSVYGKDHAYCKNAMVKVWLGLRN